MKRPKKRKKQDDRFLPSQAISYVENNAKIHKRVMHASSKANCASLSHEMMSKRTCLASLAVNPWTLIALIVVFLKLVKVKWVRW